MENSRLSYIKYILFHPFDGNYEMKTAKMGSTKISMVIILLWFFGLILNRQFRGFSFNYNKPEDINILYMFTQSFALFLAFCICNWAVCTLLEGSGKFKQIVHTTAYSLVPYIATLYISVIISRFMVSDEGVFVVWLVWTGMAWSGFLLLAGLKSIHDYTMPKTVVSIILTIVGIILLLFVFILLFSLFQEMIAFIINVYREVSYRL